jgi:hypothetical protein
MVSNNTSVKFLKDGFEKIITPACATAEYTRPEAKETAMTK